MHENESPGKVKSGTAGRKTQYEERKDFEDKALNKHDPIKERFEKKDRISTSDIKALATTRCQSQLRLLAKELDADLRAEALLEQ